MVLRIAFKTIMIILGFWLPAVLLDALRAETPEAAQAAREKFCVGCGIFVCSLVWLL